MENDHSYIHVSVLFSENTHSDGNTNIKLNWKPAVELPYNADVDIDVDLLLEEFFKFFVSFDFHREGMSLYNGQMMERKLDTSDSLVFLENPFESKTSLKNACINVKSQQLDQIQAGMQNSLQLLTKKSDISRIGLRFGLLQKYKDAVHVTKRKMFSELIT